MSLLMDALKKAEQSKAETVDATPPPIKKTVPAAIKTTAEMPANDAIELSLDEIEPLEPAFLDSPEAMPAEALTLQTTHPKETAKTEPTAAVVAPSPVKVDTQKIPNKTSTAEPESTPNTLSPPIIPALVGKKKTNHTYLWAGLILFMALVGFAYYFFAALATSSNIDIEPPPLLDWQPENTPIGDDINSVTAAPAKVQKTAVENTPAAAKQPPPPASVASPAKAAKPAQTAAAKNTRLAPEPKLESVPEKQNPPQHTLNIKRTQVTDPLQQHLQQAYNRYQAGDFDHADEHYRLVLRRDNNNHDALLGRAIIAQRQNRSTAARDFYSRLLQLNPKNSVALTGLMSLPQQGGSNHNISRLKMLLAEEPSAAHLHFALGNEHAAQQRWPAAQQAYFDAYRHAPVNGDYAFNLAVSLERIGQPQSALNYYQQALATNNQSIAFDRQQLTQHIARLNLQANVQ